MKAALILSLLILAGCQTTMPVENPRKVWCDHNSPSRHSPEVIAAMSRAELDETNAHNAKGVKWCGWRP